MQKYCRLSLALAVLFCLFAAVVGTVRAQAWNAPVRGSWVRAAGAPHPGDVTLAAPTGGCEIVVSPAENSAVQQAARFLAADIGKISGKIPTVVATASGTRAAIHLATIGVSAGLPAATQAAKMTGLWEAHRIVTVGSRDVWLVGSNFRGTAFAAYTLSERLGIDPLYLWTGYAPEHHSTLVLQKTDYYAPPPTFRYRGLFHDDEDLLPRPIVKGIPDKEGTVPTVWYARFFETALRLRMNMTAPFVRVRRPYEVQKMASDWGLFYTSHHYDALLSNPFGYDRFGLAKARAVTGPYDWATNHDGLEKFWRGGVEENRNLHCIYPVGLRGTEDFAMRFPAGTTDAQKSAAFTQAIADQERMTRELLPPGETPLFHFTMYNEMLDIYRKGMLAVPDDVMIVWPDNFDGIMRGLPETVGKWKHGVYYHLTFYGGAHPNGQFDTTKQTFHTVSPARIESEFRKIVDAHATEYMLVNVSEIRAVVRETREIADLCWDTTTVFARPHAADRFADWWAREYCGPAAAPAAAKAYRDYDALLTEPADLTLGTDKVQGAVRSLLLKFDGKPFAPALPKTLTNLQSRVMLFESALRDADAASAKMTPQEARFFFEHVTLGLLSAYRPAQAAILLVKAMSEPDMAKARSLCESARAPLEQLEQELARGEREPFAGWYGPSWILTPDSPQNPHSARKALDGLLTVGQL